MIDKMSAIASIIYKIDIVKTALSKLRSNVSDFLKSEKPLVSKKKRVKTEDD